MRLFTPTMKAMAAETVRLPSGLAGRAVATALLAALSDVAMLVILVPLVTVLAGAVVPSGGAVGRLWSLLPGPEGARVGTAVGLGLLLVLVRGLAQVANRRCEARIAAAVTARLRTRLLDPLVAAPFETVAALDQGRMLRLVSTELPQASFGASALVHIATGFTLVAGCGLMALLLSPALAAAALAMLGLALVLLRPMLQVAQRRMERAVTSGQDVFLHTRNLAADIKRLRSEHGEGAAMADLAAHHEAAERDYCAHVQTEAAQAATLAGVAMLGIFALIGFGRFALALDVATLVTAMALFSRAVAPLLQAHRAWLALARAAHSWEAVGALHAELLGTEARPVVARRAAMQDGAAVRLEKVSFTYPGRDAPVLADVDLAISPGSLCAVTGASGAGKTTLVDLVTGLLQPQAGAVTLGVAEDTLAYLGQDGVLPCATVAEVLGASESAELGHVLALTGAAAVVARLPDGLATLIGERGALLSGGERQRLALARAMLRRPELLILDEATNALDDEAERAIVAGLAALPDRPTILFVTHRQSNLDLCDAAVQVGRGRATLTASARRRRAA